MGFFFLSRRDPFKEGYIGVGIGGRARTSPRNARDVDGDHPMEGEEEMACPVYGVECLTEAFKALRIDAGQ